jgi:hypothetical protein
MTYEILVDQLQNQAIKLMREGADAIDVARAMQAVGRDLLAECNSTNYVRKPHRPAVRSSAS